MRRNRWRCLYSWGELDEDTCTRWRAQWLAGMKVKICAQWPSKETAGIENTLRIAWEWSEYTMIILQECNIALRWDWIWCENFVKMLGTWLKIQLKWNDSAIWRWLLIYDRHEDGVKILWKYFESDWNYNENRRTTLYCHEKTWKCGENTVKTYKIVAKQG